MLYGRPISLIYFDLIPYRIADNGNTFCHIQQNGSFKYHYFVFIAIHELNCDLCIIDGRITENWSAGNDLVFRIRCIIVLITKYLKVNALQYNYRPSHWHQKVLNLFADSLRFTIRDQPICKNLSAIQLLINNCRLKCSWKSFYKTKTKRFSSTHFFPVIVVTILQSLFFLF